MNLFRSPADRNGPQVTLYCDGGSKPLCATWGWAAIGTDGREIVYARGALGRASNNRAELEVLIRGLEWARENGLRRVRLLSDSLLALNLAAGTWRCRKPHLLPLVNRARELALEVDAILEWTPRSKNRRAHALARAAYREWRAAQARERAA